MLIISLRDLKLIGVVIMLYPHIQSVEYLPQNEGGTIFISYFSDTIYPEVKHDERTNINRKKD